MKQFLLALVLGLFTLSDGWSSASAAKPNIILILADDLGIGNVSCYGADYFKTPRLDALAREGLRFTHCYAQPLCGPSRAQLLTGRYAFRTGMTGNDSGPLVKPETEIMIPRVLKPAGYVTASVGKWGQLQLEPGDFGFDEYFRFQNSGVYWTEPGRRITYTINGKTTDLKEKEYMPDLMHDFLVGFIRRHRDRPFFAYYPMSHIHRNVPAQGMMRTPDSAPQSKDVFADNIAYMDKLVGKLVDELERLKLREKTLLLFVGDNGTAGTEAGRSTVRGRPLSGHKGDLLEGGSLVPMIANWPGMTLSGRTSQSLMDLSDFLPTLAEIGGAQLPSGVAIDGRSFAPELRGLPARPREWIFVELGKHWYVRNAGWKLNEKGELFDMSGAPFEEKMVSSSSEPGIAAERKQLQTVLDQLNPAAGKMDTGDGSGRHDKKRKKGKAR